MEPGNDWLGLDIGGANLKAATTGGLAEEIPFPLWKHPEQLTIQLKFLRKLVPRIDRVAVTMTGELCDCFQSKQEGVLHIVDAVETAFQGTLVWYWSNGGEWLGSKVARGFPYRLAASNWLALCQYLADTVVREPTVLVDMGSTTTDILFLSNGAVLCQGRDDPGRLNSGELVYTGLTRSPICSLVQDGYCAEVSRQLWMRIWCWDHWKRIRGVQIALMGGLGPGKKRMLALPACWVLIWKPRRGRSGRTLQGRRFPPSGIALPGVSSR